MATLEIFDRTKHNDVMPEMNWILEILKDQGLSILLIGLAVFWFLKREAALQKEIRAMNAKQVEYFEKDRVEMFKLINRFTEIIERIEELLNASRGN